MCYVTNYRTSRDSEQSTLLQPEIFKPKEQSSLFPNFGKADLGFRGLGNVVVHGLTFAVRAACLQAAWIFMGPCILQV